mmetsp:Transcript_15998/g.43155  ORF Transcript_15998/g.43155 Transcript_15998/m.43155 type:complete len:338 (-) Transcript_15998:161-1174(-)
MQEEEEEDHAYVKVLREKLEEAKKELQEREAEIQKLRSLTTTPVGSPRKCTTFIDTSPREEADRFKTTPVTFDNARRLRMLDTKERKSVSDWYKEPDITEAEAEPMDEGQPLSKSLSGWFLDNKKRPSATTEHTDVYSIYQEDEAGSEEETDTSPDHRRLSPRVKSIKEKEGLKSDVQVFDMVQDAVSPLHVHDNEQVEVLNDVPHVVSPKEASLGDVLNFELAEAEGNVDTSQVGSITNSRQSLIAKSMSDWYDTQPPSKQKTGKLLNTGEDPNNVGKTLSDWFHDGQRRLSGSTPMTVSYHLSVSPSEIAEEGCEAKPKSKLTAGVVLEQQQLVC